MPAFQQVLAAVHDAYANRRDQVEDAASNLSQALNRDLLNMGGDAKELNAGLLDVAADSVLDTFDSTYGGFGGAPKFPNPMNLEFLLRSYIRSNDENALHVVTFTLQRMARGGVYDQLGGGFHRYSVDRLWLVPHFEKMLYDNAQLSRLYLHTWQVTGYPFFKRIAEEVYDYILREMTSPEGGFYSTTDADSEGEEGKFFVWSKSELNDLLGEDARVAIEYWGISERGNFEGQNILYVPNEDEVVAQRLNLSVDELRAKLEAIKHKLYARRTQRIHPSLDDKVLTAWNGMMLASLAEAARVLGRDDYRVAAQRSGNFLLRELMKDGRLLRTYKDGVSKLNAYLEDYADLIDGLLELYQTTFDERWFVEAQRLTEVVLEHFSAENGGFFDTSDDHEALITRPRSLQDNATPSGNSMMAQQLIRLAAYTGDARYEDAAVGMLRLLVEALRQYPQAFGEALNAVDMLANGLAEVAIVGDPGEQATNDLLEIVRKPYRPNIITALATSDGDGDAGIPLLSHRTLQNGKPTMYVCRHFACANPVNSPDEADQLLREKL
jgi:uncharacterized protein YyaL (SSP411 family)